MLMKGVPPRRRRQPVARIITAITTADLFAATGVNDDDGGRNVTMPARFQATKVGLRRSKGICGVRRAISVTNRLISFPLAAEVKCGN